MIKQHKNSRDITDLKFGRLTAIYPTELRYKGQIMWLFKCDCGKEITTPISWVTSGNTQSCGCWHDERIAIYNKEAKRKPDNASNKNGLFNHYKTHAKHRKISFELTKEQFVDLIFKKCHYCGEEPKRMFRLNMWSGEFACNGVDRVNSSLGYTVKNCVPCCKQCNFMKLDYSEEQFYKKIVEIYNNKKLGDRITNINIFDGVKQ